MLSSHGVIKKMKAAGWRKIRTCGSHAVFGHPQSEKFITLPLGSGIYNIKLIDSIESVCGCSIKRSSRALKK